jgi:cytochrome c oxidase cbb3-type subunit 3
MLVRLLMFVALLWAWGAPLACAADNGAELFDRNCAACHGEHGDGGIGVTFSRPRNLPILPPALNNPGFLASATDAMIKATLMHSRQGTPMVSFLKQGLTVKDINDVVSYVRSFERHPQNAEITKAAQVAPVIVMDSPYDLKTTVKYVKEAVTNNNFFYGRVQNLEYGMTDPSHQNPNQVIVYFCNISMLNKALAIDPRVGMFLPCRITILEKNGKVQVMSINPRVLSRLFNNAQLNQLCDTLGKAYKAIMEEATL